MLLSYLVLLFLGSIGTAIAGAIKSGCDPRSPGYCKGTDGTPSEANQYVCGSSRLGPLNLPTSKSLGDLFKGYNRFGGLCPGVFWAQFRNEKGDWYRYPPEDGFQLDPSGKGQKSTTKLAPGTLVDRFGGETGTFVAPVCTSFSKRSIPPGNLASRTNDPKNPYNYHVYKVVKEFPVLSGRIAPWFAQPGGGVQYKLDKPVSTLLKDGFLKEIAMPDRCQVSYA
ncbi:hypothetical protein CDD83_6371 [Cordyceps sp. RAO-2017]|nr:hypothetical protein CDD83_6371 [Cordyceps sp. RAO-2017]